MSPTHHLTNAAIVQSWIPSRIKEGCRLFRGAFYHRIVLSFAYLKQDMANKNGSASNFADQTDDTMISAADTINNFKRLNSGRKRKVCMSKTLLYIHWRSVRMWTKVRMNTSPIRRKPQQRRPRETSRPRRLQHLKYWIITNKVRPIAVKTPRASKTSQTPQTGRVTSSIKFKGQPSNGREVGRQLVFWTGEWFQSLPSLTLPIWLKICACLVF